MVGIGIDTGGTCTDTVIYDFEKKEILASAKSATTHEKLEIGIGESLGKLPDDLVKQASCVSLSTTLATNACVENKGGRVCLIFVGVPQKTLEETYQNYGFDGTEDMRFLEGDASKGTEPDWAAFEEMLPGILEQYDSIAVSQVMPRENDGAYEKEIRRRILEKKKITVVCAYEIFQDLNVVKRGAGAYLNARLIPVIEHFFDAVHHVLLEKDIRVPFLIMRSDGSLVSEQYARQYPVETLLCGPTASVKGAAALMDEPQAVVIDMGGTTTDVALIRDGRAKRNTDGISVGGWQNFVRGIEIDTFALGGDSEVSYHNRELFLGEQRVFPISALAHKCPQILEELELQAQFPHGSTKAKYEHLLLQRMPEEKTGRYTGTERRICEILKGGPLGVCQVAEALGLDVYRMNTDRLEREGILLRSGFTPTDAMVLKGDRTYPEHMEEAVQAAEYAAAFIAHSTGRQAEEIADMVYELVKEKMYCNLVRILWEDARDGDRINCSLVSTENKNRKQSNGAGSAGGLATDFYRVNSKTHNKKEPYAESEITEVLERFAREAFAAVRSGRSSNIFFRNTFSTDAVLLGVGAPIHVFLEDVAKALHTTCRVSSYSAVSNALGALLGDACVYETVYVKAERSIQGFDEEDEAFIVYGKKKEAFSTFDEAIVCAADLAKKRATAKVWECGAAEITSVTYEVQRKEYQTSLCTMLGGAEVTACARGRFLIQE